jgi:LmbE family N-acetylglucosaminyl deacetylase
LTEEIIPKTVAVIVAHPDDETLWCGGTILDHHEWNWFIISLCRGSDPDRAPKFFNALQSLNAKGNIGDMEDGPEQKPLPENNVKEIILNLLPEKKFDLIVTHDPFGEYTRHRRHEETGKAAISLWHKRKIEADELWTFAYEDGNREYFPRPIKTATAYTLLAPDTWQNKYQIITEIYGFPKDGWEAQTTPKAEAFWKFNDAAEAMAKVGS